jgi:hypothetical protein
VEEEGALGEGGFEVSGGLDDDELGEASAEHLFDAVVDFAGPEADFDVREVFFEEGEDSRGMGDVAYVDGLPGGTQDQAAGATGGAE